MPQDVRLWSVSESSKLTDLHPSKLDLEERLETWIEQDISILSEDLLIIGRQVPTEHSGCIDLLCLDENGDLTIVELKRDRTPREVVAQTLDYASYVKDISRDQIVSLANQYLGKRDSSLEDAFRERFQAELPEALNASHNMVVVCSSLDASSERIVSYLSEVHGVGFNVATFSYFKHEDVELLARVFLIEPDKVEQRQESKGTSKRKSKPSVDEFIAAAEGVGVLHLLEPLFEELGKSLRARRSLERLGLEARLPRGGRRVINFLPGASSKDIGLKYELFERPTLDAFNVASEQLREALPEGHNPWIYGNGHDPDNRGYEGYFKTADDVTRFLALVL